MNAEQIQKLFENYIANFDMINGPVHDEKYKWNAIERVQEKWDLNAADVSEMIKQAFSLSYNLINNRIVQPVSGLAQLAKVEPEAVRQAFEALLASTDDATKKQAQIETFVDVTNALLEKHFSGKWKYAQDVHAVIAYLSMIKPAENYMFKSTPAHYFARYMDYANDIGYGQTFKLSAYYAMCDELVELIKASPEMIAIDATRDTVWKDPSYHVLAYDLIYCFGVYNLINGMKPPVPTGKAADQQQREYRQKMIESLQQNLDSLQDQVDALQKELDALPVLELVGMSMKTKAFGQATITRQEGQYIWCQSAVREHHFALPDCITNGFLIPDNPDLIERCKKDTDLNKQIGKLERQQRAKNTELQKYQQ